MIALRADANPKPTTVSIRTLASLKKLSEHILSLKKSSDILDKVTHGSTPVQKSFIEMFKNTDGEQVVWLHGEKILTGNICTVIQ